MRKTNPAQSALFAFDAGAAAHLHYGAEHGATRFAKRARQLIDTPSPAGGALAARAQVAGTFTPPAGDIGNTSPTLAPAHDRRTAAQRIAAIGGAGYVVPDDLADFADAEAAIFALMSDCAWHTTQAITTASGGQGEALRRMRNLRNRVSTSGGVLRYAHIECKRAGEKRHSLYRLSWHDQPQRNGAGRAER